MSREFLWHLEAWTFLVEMAWYGKRLLIPMRPMNLVTEEMNMRRFILKVACYEDRHSVEKLGSYPPCALYQITWNSEARSENSKRRLEARGYRILHSEFRLLSSYFLLT